jgi:5-methylcytosine-specific restriction endonuclease McrA
LPQGTVLSPGALLPWLDEAYLERAVFTPEGRVECSATPRVFTGATRRAIELRDRECTHPYCDTPATECQADHIVPYVEGGSKTQENGRLLCGFHNRLRNGRPPP